MTKRDRKRIAGKLRKLARAVEARGSYLAIERTHVSNILHGNQDEYTLHVTVQAGRRPAKGPAPIRSWDVTR